VATPQVVRQAAANRERAEFSAFLIDFLDHDPAVRAAVGRIVAALAAQHTRRSPVTHPAAREMPTARTIRGRGSRG
jgi:hypothetical protein